MTAWDAKHVNLFSDHEVTLVYERAKIACVLIQVDMKTIEIAYGSQWNVGMSYNTSCHENRPHAIAAAFYQMVK